MTSADLMPPQPTLPRTSWEIKAKVAFYLPIPLLLLTFFYPDRLWNTLLAGSLCAHLIAFVWARSLARGVRAQRVIKKQWVSVGDRLVEEFNVWHSGILPALWFELRDYSNVPQYEASTVRSLLNGRVRWQCAVICEQRGQFRLGAWEIVTQDPLGFFEIVHRFPIVAQLIIYPPIHVGLGVRLPTGASDGQIDARGRAWEATSRVATIRPYAPQDPFRWIHWPTTARSNQLQVRHFDRDEGGDVWLLLDLMVHEQIGTNLASTHEQAIIIAASLVAEALHQNRAVGLAVYGRRLTLIPPNRGHAQRLKLMQALATLVVDGTADLATSVTDLARTVRHGSSILMVTPTASTEFLSSLLHLKRRSVGLTVVLQERSSFGAADSNAPLLSTLRRLGINAVLQRNGALGQLSEGMRL